MENRIAEIQTELPAQLREAGSNRLSECYSNSRAAARGLEDQLRGTFQRHSSLSCTFVRETSGVKNFRRGR